MGKLRHSKINESLFKKKVCEKLTSCGAKVLSVHGHAMQATGWPDIYVSHEKWRGFIEFKVDKRVVQTNQKICLCELCKRGDIPLVLRLKNLEVKMDGDSETQRVDVRGVLERLKLRSDTVYENKIYCNGIDVGLGLVELCSISSRDLFENLQRWRVQTGEGLSSESYCNW